jgi:DNA ligase-1
MPDLADGEKTTVQGSGSSVYELKNSGGVYSCTCPAWRNQSIGIERRTCKHLRAFRGDAAEIERLGAAALTGKPPRPPRAPGEAPDGDDDDEGPPLLLAHKWEVDTDLTGWWMSEKLDGVRAYWDGTQFLSRLGNKFYPPPWFVDGLPNHPLDGELWGGRKRFQRTVGIVKRQDQSPLWKELLYVVFDAPAHDGPFEARIAHAKSSVEGKSPYTRVHEHWTCKGTAHLKEELARVEALGGEGLMARKPGSRYEAGRSSTLLKVKNFKDAEARVMDHAAGAGRHKGRLGALVVELADGTRFNVGTGFSDAEREDPPPIGSIVTFRYQELSDDGVPRFPSFVGVRVDANKPSTLGKPVVSRPADPPAPPKAPVRPPAAAEAPAVRPSVRRFEMVEGGTRYFWEIEADGTKHRARFGTFDVKVKTFASVDESQEALEARIQEKLENGFVEVGD